ncbi:uncharacterized protein LOC121735938 [Aricia agestis]|uniref:uncharacterized protein LOC121735938 n=1 Tax=Aricia agestis TaxID=91739 RepID=UPI001C2088F9|nr:uncharacterized protein LOC121735938 [Aricia agestis]
MMVKTLFTSILLLELVRHVRTHIEMEAEDYFFPLEPVINYCKLADQCQHDFVISCGQDTLGISRMFLDICDMYEYNCDEKKQYHHVKMDVCHYEFAAAQRIAAEVDADDDS